MMLYIIGPMTFQMIVIGLLLEKLGVRDESITIKGQQNKEEPRQEATEEVLRS